MGKNRHSKDRLFITSTEWGRDWGGKKVATIHENRPVPFSHCAISLTPYETPCCTDEGVIFDVTNLVPYVMKHKKNPITGEPMATNQIIRLNMSKNADDVWQCPVTCKVFNDNTHVVAIKTTGNVYCYDAVYELNIKAKNFTDLLTGEKFVKADIITLQDPQNEEHMARRDVSTFVHLHQIREENKVARQTDSKVRQNPTMDSVMKELEQRRATESSLSSSSSSLLTSKTVVSPESIQDVKDLLALNALTVDVEPGTRLTSGKSGSALTSSCAETITGNTIRTANADELREARWKRMRELGKKGYAQLQTSHGNLNLEIHCDIVPMACWNFITLCERGFYDNTVFHRLVPGFMLQGGDPTGTGSGGESAWGKDKPFKDTYDSRIIHNARGVLSYANSGSHTNRSQFFLTFSEASHLDYKHTVFGRLVGGANVLDRLEAIGSDKKETPLEEIQLLKVVVFTNPIPEADALLVAEIASNTQKRLQAEKISKERSGLPSSSSSSSSSNGQLAITDAIVDGTMDGQLLTNKGTSSSSSSSSSGGGGTSMPSIGKYLHSTVATAGTGTGTGTGTTRPSTTTAMMPSFGDEGQEEPRPMKKIKTTSSSGFSDFSGW